MSKKTYVKPTQKVVVLHTQHHLLALSDPKTPGIGAPQFDLDDDEP